jgi:hypothetical protein
MRLGLIRLLCARDGEVSGVGAPVSRRAAVSSSRHESATPLPLAFAAALVVLAALATALALSDPAHAINRKQADQIAMKKLKTESKPDVILFRDARQLRPRDTVAFATRKRVPASRKGFPRIGKRAWLYWQDLAPQAGFEHASEMLLINARNGRVMMRKKLLYWPIVNGKAPAYLRSPKAYSRNKYRVFEKLKFPPPTALAQATSTGHALSQPDTPIRSSGESARRLSAGFDLAEAFQREGTCLYLLGEAHTTPVANMNNDLQAVADLAREIGWPAFFATGPKFAPKGASGRFARPNRALMSDGTPEALIKDIKHLRDQKKCRDLVIFAAGHGSETSTEAQVSMTASNAGGKTPHLTPSTIKKVVKAFPKMTFKLKILSCYSRRFESELKNKKGRMASNILVVETSAGAHQESHRDEGKKIFEFTRANIEGIRGYAKAVMEGSIPPTTHRGSYAAGALIEGTDRGRPFNEGEKRGQEKAEIFENPAPGEPDNKHSFKATQTGDKQVVVTVASKHEIGVVRLALDGILKASSAGGSEGSLCLDIPGSSKTSVAARTAQSSAAPPWPSRALSGNAFPLSPPYWLCFGGSKELMITVDFVDQIPTSGTAQIASETFAFNFDFVVS